LRAGVIYKKEKVFCRGLSKGAQLAGEYSCPGFDTFGPFKLVGGIVKGHPSEEDIAGAVDFLNEIH